MLDGNQPERKTKNPFTALTKERYLLFNFSATNAIIQSGKPVIGVRPEKSRVVFGG